MIEHKGNELKLVYPKVSPAPDVCNKLAYDCFFLQPMDGPDLVINIHKIVEYCLANPHWRLSHQSHKMLGIP